MAEGEASLGLFSFLLLFVSAFGLYGVINVRKNFLLIYILAGYLFELMRFLLFSTWNLSETKEEILFYVDIVFFVILSLGNAYILKWLKKAKSYETNNKFRTHSRFYSEESLSLESDTSYQPSTKNSDSKEEFFSKKTSEDLETLTGGSPNKNLKGNSFFSSPDSRKSEEECNFYQYQPIN